MTNFLQWVQKGVPNQAEEGDGSEVNDKGGHVFM